MNTISSSVESTEALHGLQAALACLAAGQRENGCWEGEVVWCPMILAQYVIARRILGREVDERTRAGIIRHFEVTRRDGAGWGLLMRSLRPSRRICKRKPIRIRHRDSPAGCRARYLPM